MRSVSQALVTTLAVGLLGTPVFAQAAASTPDLLPGADLVTDRMDRRAAPTLRSWRARRCLSPRRRRHLIGDR